MNHTNCCNRYQSLVEWLKSLSKLVFLTLWEKGVVLSSHAVLPKKSSETKIPLNAIYIEEYKIMCLRDAHYHVTVVIMPQLSLRQSSLVKDGI